jgi:hypothetical protein
MLPNPKPLDADQVTTIKQFIYLALFTSALLAGIAQAPVAQAAETPPHHFASLQLLHPLATSPDPETTTNFRFSLFYGRSGGVSGVDFNAVAGYTSGDVTAFQLNGLYSRTGGLFRGMSATLGVTHVQGGGAGFQFSGLANYNEDALAGLQMTGVLNYVNRGFAGAQVSGVLNLNDGGGTFLQAASVANINAGPFAGFQISAFMNAANSQIGGGQLAIVNFAENMAGVQVGVFNMSTEFQGLKVGIVNTSQEFGGTAIGLVNMDSTSRKEWMFYGSNLSLANIGFRTVLNNWSSIVSTGYGDTQGDVGASLFFGWNFGRNIPLTDRWDLTIDLGYQHIIPKTSNNPAENDRLHYSLQARAVGEFHLKENLGLVGSVGSSSVFSEYSSDAESETDVHFIAGIVLY